MYLYVLQLGVWLDKTFSLIKECPRYLVPCYFDAIITPLYLKLLDRAWSQMSRFVFSVAGGFAPNRVRTHRVRTQLQSTLTAFTPKYAYYLEYFSFFKREKSVTTLEIGGGELSGCELGWERNLHHSYFLVFTNNLITYLKS